MSGLDSHYPLVTCVCVCAGLEWVTLTIRFQKCVCVHVCSWGAFVIVRDWIHVCPVNQSSSQQNNSRKTAFSLSMNLSLSFSLSLYSISHTVYSNGINKAARNAVIRGFTAFLDQCNYSHPLATSRLLPWFKTGTLVFWMGKSWS